MEALTIAPPIWPIPLAESPESYDAYREHRAIDPSTRPDILQTTAHQLSPSCSIYDHSHSSRHHMENRTISDQSRKRKTSRIMKHIITPNHSSHPSHFISKPHPSIHPPTTTTMALIKLNKESAESSRTSQASQPSSSFPDSCINVSPPTGVKSAYISPAATYSRPTA